jgi:tetratricopeptide (TPR) repeat protein
MFSDYFNAYYRLATISQYTYNLQQSLLQYLQAVKEIEESGLTEELAYPYFLIGKIYLELNQVDKSIEYSQQSLAVSHRKGEIVVINGLIRMLAHALLNVGKAREAMQVLNDFMAQQPALPLKVKQVWPPALESVTRPLSNTRRRNSISSRLLTSINKAPTLVFFYMSSILPSGSTSKRVSTPKPLL